MTYGLRSYSSVHKVRSCWSHLIKPRILTNRVWFAEPDRASYSDTYGIASTVTGYSFNGGTAQSMVTETLDDKTITGKIVMHEIGNGVNDMLLNKCILEIMPSSAWTTYTYDSVTNPDPSFIFDTRSSSWLDGQGTNEKDLIALNMDVRGGKNPFASVMETPNDELSYSGEKVPFDGDDSWGAYKGKPTESLIALAPMNSKFRRALFTFESDVVVMVRSITVQFSEYKRKGFG